MSQCYLSQVSPGDLAAQCNFPTYYFSWVTKVNLFLVIGVIIYWICGFAFAFGKNKYAEVGLDGETTYKYSSANSFIGKWS